MLQPVPESTTADLAAADAVPAFASTGAAVVESRAANATRRPARRAPARRCAFPNIEILSFPSAKIELGIRGPAASHEWLHCQQGRMLRLSGLHADEGP